jgi:hypothetical protein
MDEKDCHFEAKFRFFLVVLIAYMETNCSYNSYVVV